MNRTLCIFLLVLCLQGCAENSEPVRLIHTSFSESSGLTVTEGAGKPRQLIAESMGVRVMVSPGGEWIVVEDMQLSNLVVIRAFRHGQEGYRETDIAEIRPHWEMLARQAGVPFEDLIHPRVGLEAFGSSEGTVLLHFQAYTGPGEHEEIDSVVEIQLDSSVR